MVGVSVLLTANQMFALSLQFHVHDCHRNNRWIVYLKPLMYFERVSYAVVHVHFILLQDSAIQNIIQLITRQDL